MITLTQEVIPFYLTKLNVIAKENDGHLVLNRVSLIIKLKFVTNHFLVVFTSQTTWADIYFAGIIDYLNYLTKIDLLENFPGLRQVVDGVLNNENVKNYIAKRPVTEV